MLYSIITPAANSAKIFFASGTTPQDFLGRLFRDDGAWKLRGDQGAVIWEMPREIPPTKTFRQSWNTIKTEYTIGDAINFLRLELKGQNETLNVRREELLVA